MDKVGADRIVVSADHDNGHIVIRGWQDATDIKMTGAIRNIHDDFGIANFLITNVSRDGTLQGPDISYLGQACAISDEINIIASGGISGARDVPLVAKAGAGE